MWAWLTFIGALMLVVLLWWTAIRLARSRRGGGAREEFNENLARMAQSLGLAPPVESSIYGVGVLTLEGIINGFRLSLEIWHHGDAPFSRLTLVFPKPLRQGLRVLDEERVGVMQRAMGMESLSLGDESTSTKLVVLAANEPDRIREFLTPDVESSLIELEAAHEQLYLEDESIFVLNRNILKAEDYERLIRQALRLATRLSQRAEELGPKATKTGTNYAQAQSQMFSRTSTQVANDAGGPGPPDEDQPSKVSEPLSS